MRVRQFSTRILLAVALLSPWRASATLGLSVSSVEHDRQLLQGAKKISVASAYTVHEIAAGGNTIREYVSPEGKVFAITWRGMTHPDLSVLLGQYFSEFQTQAAAQIASRRSRDPRFRGHRGLAVRTSAMVLLRGGHMRDLHGRAYLPQWVPAGVDVGSLP